VLEAEEGNQRQVYGDGRRAAGRRGTVNGRPRDPIEQEQDEQTEDEMGGEESDVA
jgi:hypothetical protein